MIMTLPPTSFIDVSSLLAIMAIFLFILLAISTIFKPSNFVINLRKLKNAAIIVGILFLITVIIQILTWLAFESIN